MKFSYLLPLLFIPMMSCDSNYREQQVEIKQEPAAENNDHLVMAALYMQQSAEYEALCRQVYQNAERQLMATHASGLPDSAAVVMDLDETVLDNSPYAGYQIHTGSSYSVESWQKWTSRAEAGAVPGARRFLNTADSLGLHIIYLSNRRVEELAPTVTNMNNLNLPQTDSGSFYLRTDKSEKETRRKAVKEQGFKPVMFFGDQLGDFDRAWDTADHSFRRAEVQRQSNKFGAVYFMLPNPVYGLWERALFEDQGDLTPKQKDSLRKEAIKAFEL